MQNKYTQNKGAKVIKRIKAEIWYQQEVQKSIRELKQWMKSLPKN